MLGFLPKYNLIVLLLNSINAQLRSYNHYIFLMTTLAFKIDSC